MAQLQITQFGGIDVLQLAPISTLTPAADAVALQVHYASVNPVDAKTRAGLGWAAQKFKDTLPWTPGFDLMGVVTAVGAEVGAFSVGQRVCGMSFQGGAYASAATAAAVDLCGVPNAISDQEAAALPLAGLTAYQGLFEHGQLKAGETVLISAAAGGVGHLAVQLAKNAGAKVIATASKSNHDFILQCGADVVIDYHDEAAMTAYFAQADLVFDLVGFESGKQALNFLKVGGRSVTVPTVTAPQIKEAAEAQGKTALGMLVHSDPQGLQTLVDLCAAQKIKVHVSQIFPLHQGAAAHAAIETGRTRGKLLFDTQAQE